MLESASGFKENTSCCPHKLMSVHELLSISVNSRGTQTAEERVRVAGAYALESASSFKEKLSVSVDSGGTLRAGP